MKGFGIAGSVAGVAQFPIDVYNFGLKEGTENTLEGITDPLGIIPDGQGAGCVFFNGCYAAVPPMA
ncbi:hypothetical protein [Streptomyces sp. NBC_01262]|uniref:hypothetical protein n=1 Tax=Streptomyces sp. NBC_01262 TaxID=2903803 RepID=UPI002E2FC807|nr:hypothetical protein [Streptomyces sp. NBC_01262]